MRFGFVGVLGWDGVTNIDLIRSVGQSREMTYLTWSCTKSPSKRKVVFVQRHFHASQEATDTDIYGIALKEVTCQLASKGNIGPLLSVSSGNAPSNQSTVLVSSEDGLQ